MSNTDIAKQRTARIAQLIREEGVDHATAKLMVADEFTFAASVPQTAVAPAVTATATVAKPAKVKPIGYDDLPDEADFGVFGKVAKRRKVLEDGTLGSYGYVIQVPSIALPDGRVILFTSICATVRGTAPKSK